MRFPRLAWPRRSAPRDMVLRAGGLWFADVLDTVAACLSHASRAARAAFAAWCAERALSASHALRPEAQAAREFWRLALGRVWDALESGSDAATESLAAALENAEQASRAPEGEALDEDGTAACIYAVQSYVTSDPLAPRWAAQRAVDAAFAAVVDSSRANDLAADALQPAVQDLLRAMQETLAVVDTPEMNGDVVARLRTAR